MKKTVSILLSLILTLTAFSACQPKEANTVVRVLNLGQYIADGSEDSQDIRKIFEERTGIKVVYEAVDHNDLLYTKVKSGAADYDVIVTSDYMLSQMINENLLQKLDYDKISNWGNIYDKYKNPSFDPNQEYTVPYFVGMVGLFYNSKKIKEAPDSWEVFWDPEYDNKFMMFADPRDSLAIAQSVLGYSYNTLNLDEWKAAADKIKEQNRYGFGSDDISPKLQSEEILLAPYYNGDIFIAQENPDIELVFPKEGVNVFIDSLAILKDAENVEAAHKFIDFLLDPEIALENAEYVGYASPNKAVVENPDYSYYKNEYLYPSVEPKTEVFKGLPQEVRDYINGLWDEITKQ